MKKILTLVLLFVFKFSFSQNLIPNYSFEDTVSCPTAPNQISKALGWSSYIGTPDYLNTCASSASLVSVPSNGGGYQIPRTGNAYAGFAPMNIGGGTTREGFGVKLIDSLTIGKTYYISFYVSRAVSHVNAIGIASNKIGARFSTVPYNASTPVPIDNHAQVYTDSIIADTINWVNISGYFIADSAYKYLSISNFFRDSLTAYIRYDSLEAISYYYVDDIWVSDSLLETANNEYDLKLIKVFPNPARDWIVVEGSDLKSISLFDVFGKEYVEDAFAVTSLHKINTSNLGRGIYLIRITTLKSTYNKTIILTN